MSRFLQIVDLMTFCVLAKTVDEIILQTIWELIDCFLCCQLSANIHDIYQIRSSGFNYRTSTVSTSLYCRSINIRLNRSQFRPNNSKSVATNKLKKIYFVLDVHHRNTPSCKSCTGMTSSTWAKIDQNYSNTSISNI